MQSNLAGPDYYTRAIIGEKITLVLGRPVSSPLALVPRPAEPERAAVARPEAPNSTPLPVMLADAVPSSEAAAAQVAVERTSSVPAPINNKAEQPSKRGAADGKGARLLTTVAAMPKWARVACIVAAVPAIIFIGALGARSIEGMIFGDPLPGISAKPSSVRVVDQEYKAPAATPQLGGPLPIAGQPTQEPASAAPAAVGGPLPVPMSKGVPDVVPAPSLPLDILTRSPSAPAAAAPAKPDKKDQPPALVVDDGGAKAPAIAAVPPAPKAPAAAPATQPAPAAKPQATPAPAPATRPAAATSGPVKLAQPVEDRAVQQALPAKAGTAPAATPAAAANEAKITIVDIVPGGKAVLVTNPATRLPQRVAVGEKLPNGRTVQSIDEKAGSVTADGATYKIE
jgi:hypothetical protein